MLGRTFMCRINSSGPNTEPCGTPYSSEVYLYIFHSHLPDVLWYYINLFNHKYAGCM